MQWWCSATDTPWSWAWQWYPGVDLMLIAVAAGWWTLGRLHRWPTRPWRWFIPAWLTLLATLDWPIGKLGAGYLASVHTGQFLLMTLAVAPLMIRSIPREGWLRLAPPGSHGWRVLRFMARALPGLLCYNIFVLTSHFPGIVDSAMRSQLGSFGLDLAWLVAGLSLWWPILAPEEFISLGVFGKIGFLFGATIGPTIPAMMMVFSDWPLYRLYELAPRVAAHFSANDDIKLAGLCMKLIGDLPIWGAAIVVFFRGTSAQGELVDA